MASDEEDTLEDKQGRGRLRLTLLTGAAALMVALPIGYAAARSGGDSSQPPVVAKQASAADKRTVRRAIAASSQHLPRNYGDKVTTDATNYIGDSVPPSLVASCRDNYEESEGCGVALAMDDGKLPAGEYSNEELEQAVSAAGYTWSP